MPLQEVSYDAEPTQAQKDYFLDNYSDYLENTAGIEALQTAVNGGDAIVFGAAVVELNAKVDRDHGFDHYVKQGAKLGAVLVEAYALVESTVSVDDGTHIGRQAEVYEEASVGRNVVLCEMSAVTKSIVEDDAVIGKNSIVEKDSRVSKNARVGEKTYITSSVLEQDSSSGDDNELMEARLGAGAVVEGTNNLFVGVSIPEAATVSVSDKVILAKDEPRKVYRTGELA